MGPTGAGVTTLQRNPTPVAEAELADAALAASGDGRAFERLYRAHAARIHSLARRMVDADHADDLTQAVLHLKMAIACDPQSALLRTALAEVEAEVGKKP